MMKQSLSILIFSMLFCLSAVADIIEINPKFEGNQFLLSIKNISNLNLSSFEVSIQNDYKDKEINYFPSKIKIAASLSPGESFSTPILTVSNLRHITNISAHELPFICFKFTYEECNSENSNNIVKISPIAFSVKYKSQPFVEITTSQAIPIIFKLNND